MSKKSIETFLEQIRSGAIETNRHRVYHYLSLRGASNLDSMRQEISGMPHQSLTSALSTLNDNGYIWQRDDGCYEVTPAHQIDQIAHRRDYQKFLRWVKNGEEKGYFMRKFEHDMDEARDNFRGEQIKLFAN